MIRRFSILIERHPCNNFSVEIAVGLIAVLEYTIFINCYLVAFLALFGTPTKA